MESRIQRILLALALLFTSALLPSLVVAEEESVGDNNALTTPVIEPELARREIKRPKIDSEDFEVTAFAGILSIEDFGSDTVLGLRFAHHVTESTFYELSYGTAEAGETSIERLSGNLSLIGDERDYTYYNISLGYNLLPGESFIGKRRAFNSTFYLVAGIGSTSFADEDRFTVSFGAGYRFLLTDWLALRIDARDHLFNTDLLGDDKATHNLEFVASLGFFF